MIDLKRVGRYRENNRIEAKKSLGGLPKSIWETYSAFANTLGGIILLGVREEKDKSLHPVRLPDPQKLVDEFWTIINDTSKVSANILTRKHVEIVGVDESQFIAITIPRASRQDRPIYIGNDPYLGSYKRNGEGDYRCEAEEVDSMLRERGKTARDMRAVIGMDMRALDKNSVKTYRELVLNVRPHTPLVHLDEKAFLQKIGVLIKDDKEVLRPSCAGLLMLGKPKKIKEVFPHYHLSFDNRISVPKSRDYTRGDKWTEENVFSFFTRVNDSISNVLEKNGVDAQAAATETLTNCLVNADYTAKSGVYVTCKKTELIYSNPGGFRLSVDVAKTGGLSDPRNLGLLRLFQQMGVGNGTGSGIPSIYALWGKDGRGLPIIKERFHPERVQVTLPLSIRTNRKNTLRSKAGKERFDEEEKRAIIEYVTDRISVTIADLCSALRLPSTQVKNALVVLVEEGVLRKEGNTYLLKS